MFSVVFPGQGSQKIGMAKEFFDKFADNALANGYTVEDLTSAMLYEDFKAGKYTPDVMLQVYEPTAIMIMAIGEKARIDYKFSSEDTDVDEEDDTIEQSNILKDISRIALQ